MMKQVENLHVVAAIIENKQGEILLAQRPEGKYLAGLWEFPGGKVESEESAAQALARELNEELGILVLQAQHYKTLEHEYPDRIVLLEFWRVLNYTGEPQGQEGQAIIWATPTHLKSYPVPAANLAILESLCNLK